MYKVLVLLCVILVGAVDAKTEKNMDSTELLSVKSGQLKELEYKVSGRSDVEKQEVGEGLHRYLIQGRFETYYFTSEQHPAHPIAIFRGKVNRTDGTTGFDQRAWSASTNPEAVTELLKSLEALGTEKL